MNTPHSFQLDSQGWYILKRAGAVLDYSVDWTEWCAKIGDAAQNFAWTHPDGLTVVGAPTSQGNVATVRYSGGVVGETYWVQSIIQTPSRTRPYAFRIVVVE